MLVLSFSTESYSDTFLFSKDNISFGCLDCGSSDEKSICSLYGNYGLEHSEYSIWNVNGIGNLQRQESPFSKNGKGLGIFDSNGDFKGHLHIDNAETNEFSKLLNYAWLDAKQSHSRTKQNFCKLMRQKFGY